MTTDSSATAALNLTPVDPDSPIPLYYQIENDLRRLISSGQVPAGTTFPPEMELCERYGVGRHTVRMALSRLAADHLITRRAGRGTTVQPQPDRMKFYLDRSFTRQMAEMGRQARSEVVDMITTTIDANCPAVFRNKMDAPCLHLARLRFGDDEPVGLQSTIILTERCPNLEKFNFNQHSLYDVLSRAYQLIITQIHHTVSAAVADEFQADLLRLAQGDPLLVVNTTASLDDGQIIEYTTSHYRTDRYEYSITHSYSA